MTKMGRGLYGFDRIFADYLSNKLMLISRLEYDEKNKKYLHPSALSAGEK